MAVPESLPLHDVVAGNGKLQTHVAVSTLRAASSDEAKDPNVDVQPMQKRKWYYWLNPLRLQNTPPVSIERFVSREYGASFFSAIFFEWMSPLIKVGYLRSLELQDIWTVNPDRKVDVLSARLDTALEKRIEKDIKHLLLWAMYDTFRFELLIGGFCQLIGSILLVFAPFLLRYLIDFATKNYVAQKTGQPTPHIGRGMSFVIGIACMQQLQSLCTNQFLYRSQMVGAQARAVLISVIFEKAMKLSARAKAGGQARPEESSTPETKNSSKNPSSELTDDDCGWSNGRITTLMGIDVDRINLACGLFHMLWTCPISIIVTLVLLVINLGYSCLAGFALLVIGMPFLGRAMKSLTKRRETINKTTDQRVSLTQEVIKDVRFVKYFGWESSFLDRLKEIRWHEIQAIRLLFILRSVVFCVMISIPVFVPLLSFVTYSLTDHHMDPALVFSSLALFNSLRMPLNVLPSVAAQVTDAWTALKRIQDFLLAEERKEDIKWDEQMEDAIEIEHASFTWERLPTDKQAIKKVEKNPAAPLTPTDQPAPSGDKTADEISTEPFKLNDMSIKVGRNELLAVIGTVGCGKSSLLSALAGDMRLTDGTV